MYQLYFVDKLKQRSIHLSLWPTVDANLVNEQAEKAGDLFVDILSTIRKYKSEHDVALNAPVTSLIIECSGEQQKLLAPMENDLKNAATAANLAYGVGNVACSRHDVRVKVELAAKKA